MKLLALLLVAFLGVSHGFVPTSVAFKRNALFSSTGDSFDSYEATPETTTLAFKDTVVGDGESAEKGKGLTVAYEGRLMSNNKVFDSGTGFSFRLGEGRVIPGWEQGIEVSTF